MEVFDFSNYKDFLNQKLDHLDQGGRGARARMSRAIDCQTAYTAQVLRGKAHFNLEQGEAINDFLGHTEDQGQYFLLLIQYAKAGTPKLRKRFEKQMDSVRKTRVLLKNRLQVEDQLGPNEQHVYYSSWHFGAIHAMVSVPGFQDPETIAQRLEISVQKVQEALEFLLSTRLLERNDQGGMIIGRGQIHLGVDSPLISKHHINWRLQAMRSIEKNIEKGLHYSSVLSISQTDANLIREKLIEFLQDIRPIIRDSKEEKVCSLSVDFFDI